MESSSKMILLIMQSSKLKKKLKKEPFKDCLRWFSNVCICYSSQVHPSRCLDIGKDGGFLYYDDPMTQKH